MMKTELLNVKYHGRMVGTLSLTPDNKISFLWKSVRSAGLFISGYLTCVSRSALVSPLLTYGKRPIKKPLRIVRGALFLCVSRETLFRLFRCFGHAAGFFFSIFRMRSWM